MRSFTTQPTPPTPPDVRAAGARDMARLDRELANARRAAAAAERQAGTSPGLALPQPPNAQGGGTLAEQLRALKELQTADQGSNTNISRSADGKTTTITSPGKTVTITNGEDGRVVITENGKTVTIDPSVIANEAARGALSGLTGQAIAPPPFPGGDDGIPQSVFNLIVFLVCAVVVLIIGFPIARAIARRMDRRAAPPDQEVVRRLDNIEQAIETIAVEVERVSEAQRYSARLLTERLPEVSPARAIAADQAR
jgi:hypothetical protein